jgi:hypothetical protein
MVMNAKVVESPRDESINHYHPGYQWYTTTTQAAPNITETYAAVPGASRTGGNSTNKTSRSGCCSWCCDGFLTSNNASYSSSARNGHRPTNSESDEDGFGGVVLSVTGGAVLNHFTNNGSNVSTSNQLHGTSRNSLQDSSRSVCCSEKLCCLSSSNDSRTATAATATGHGATSAHRDSSWCRPTVLVLFVVLLIVVFVIVSGILLYLNCT